MIQRIQTVFLVLSIVLLGLFCWQPLIIDSPPPLPKNVSPAVQIDRTPVEFKGYEVTFKLRINGTPYLVFINLIFAATSAGFTLIAIALFKRRSLQVKVTWCAVVFCMASLAFVFYEFQRLPAVYNRLTHNVDYNDVYLTPWYIAGAAALIMQLLAIYYIKKDEALIKSLDRLR